MWTDRRSARAPEPPVCLVGRNPPDDARDGERAGPVDPLEPRQRGDQRLDLLRSLGARVQEAQREAGLVVVARNLGAQQDALTRSSEEGEREPVPVADPRMRLDLHAPRREVAADEDAHRLMAVVDRDDARAEGPARRAAEVRARRAEVEP